MEVCFITNIIVTVIKQFTNQFDLVGALICPIASDTEHHQHTFVVPQHTHGCSPAHVGCSPAHVGCSPAHVGCSPAHVGCSPAHVGCSPTHGCSPAHVGCSPAHVGCSARFTSVGSRVVLSSLCLSGFLNTSVVVLMCRRFLLY